MAKDRQTPCKSYICEDNPCKKGKIAKHKGLCQTCKAYEPRAHIKHQNLKKAKLEKIKKNERYDE